MNLAMSWCLLQNQKTRRVKPGNSITENGAEHERTSSLTTDHLIEQAIRMHDDESHRVNEELIASGLDERLSKILTYKRLLSTYRRTLRRLFKKRVLDCHRLKNDAVYLSIVKTATTLRKKYDYDEDESIMMAIEMRKYKINDLLPDNINS